MENPLTQPIPSDAVDRVHEFARDLAYGVAKGAWGTLLYYTYYAGGRADWNIDSMKYDADGTSPLGTLLTQKWDGQEPSAHMMVTFGYFSDNGKTESGYTFKYRLNKSAFDLLVKPLTAPSVFVSYRRRQSSALALLVEARLLLADRDIQVFVDKDIPIGDDWEELLKQKVQGCRYFICLIGEHTLSANVMDEIEWAFDADCKVITMLHPGYQFDAVNIDDPRAQALITKLSAIQSIPIKSESAEDYDSALRKLLNSMGYSTL